MNPDASADALDSDGNNDNKQAPDGADLDGIAAVLADSSPIPNEAAIAAHSEKELERAASYAHLRDAQGRAFDKELHVTDADGEPKLTGSGKLRMRPGRKKGSTIGSSGKPASQGFVGGVSRNTATDDSIKKREQARITGQTAAASVIMLGVAFGGEEWKPRKEPVDEMEYLSQAFADYFIAKDMQDLPPGVALSVAMMGYAAPRFAMPKTQSRTKLFVAWARNKLQRNKKAKGSRDDGTQSNPGNDGKRENDASEKTGRAPKK